LPGNVAQCQDQVDPGATMTYKKGETAGNVSNIMLPNASKAVMDETELRNSLIALHPASFAWAMVCCRDRELAEEVLQSVYVKVLDGHSAYEGGSSFRTWLFAVIRNAAHDRRRRRRWLRVVRLEFESFAEFVDATGRAHPQIADEDELTMIRAALGELPQRQQQIAHLVFYEDLTVADAAHVMGVSIGAARQHYARAKESLRALLKPLWNQTNEPIDR
jgi:RNA polymerase sigma factor (sigma-70 family)